MGSLWFSNAPMSQPPVGTPAESTVVDRQRPDVVPNGVVDIPAEGAVVDRQRAVIADAAAEVFSSPIPAEGAIADRQRV